MKKILSIFLAVGLVFIFSSQFVQAQSIKKYSGKKSVSLPGGIYRSIDCQENYDYYVGEDGSYIKSGNYSLKGSANQIRGSVNATYNVTATYKNGLLNGHLSARVTVKGRGDWNRTFHDYDQYNVDYTLSANFKDGIPDGQWTYTETGLLNDDKSIYKTTFNCKNGVFVGDFNCNFSSLTLPSHLTGKFDQDGKLLSLIINNQEEYNLNSAGDLLSYFFRDENNKTIKKFQYDETLQKEYDEQNNSSVKSFINEKGYYLTRSSSQETIKFGTLTILDYIWNRLVLQKSIDGTKLTNGFFSSYPYNKYNIEKVPAKKLTEAQFSELLKDIKYYLNYPYNGYDESMSKETVLNEYRKDRHIYWNGPVLFKSINDTVRYFDDSQSALFKESVYQEWDKILENKRKKKEKELQRAKDEIANKAKTKTTKIIDEVASWPMDAYKEDYVYQGWSFTNLHSYYNIGTSGGQGDIDIFDFFPQGGRINFVMKKFEKFHKVDSYSFDNIYVTDNLDTCWVYLLINKKNEKLEGYQTYKSEALFLSSNSGILYADGKYIVNIDIDKSFEKLERIPNLWDTVNALIDTSKNLKKELQSYQKLFKSVYKSYADAYKYFIDGDKEDPKNQYEYWQNNIAIQKGYLRFIGLVKQIDEISEKIALNAKEESDIAKSYQNVQKTWSMDVNGKIEDEVKRLEGVRTIQDSCLKFIELRKTITQNNTKIADYAKTAPTIVKAYNTHMKSVDLTWNQESRRNQAIREIIQMQNELISAFSKPNISEIDKTVKKSKAKSWEDVKKIVLQH